MTDLKVMFQKIIKWQGISCVETCYLDSITCLEKLSLQFFTLISESLFKQLAG